MEKNEVAIIGLGPAGIAAAIYLKRYGMNPVCFERDLVGGKTNYTESIENYPGYLEFKGPTLSSRFEEQLKHFGIKPIYKEVKKLKKVDDHFLLSYGKEQKEFKYVIIANGLKEKELAIAGEEAFNSFDAKINACVAWTDVQTFIDENLNSLDPSGYYGYLTEKVKQGGQFSPAGLSWTKFMSDTYGYTNTVASGGTANVSLVKGYHAREKLRPYGVSTYKDATCYYTWWVKHSNDNDNSKVGPMEYGIVRNNIYKLTVKSVAGLGGDVPGGTPENGDDIVIHVKVNDWMLLDEEEIIM